MVQEHTANGRLAGKVAIVTGGGYGFGAGIVEKFVEEGARVLVVDNKVSRGQEVAKEQPRHMASFCHADVTQSEDWVTILATVNEQFGRLDIVVNNAGAVHKMASSAEVPTSSLNALHASNVVPLHHCINHCIPAFLAQTSPGNTTNGVILNVSSIAASRPRPGLVWYAASKASVSAATKGLAAEFAAQGIRVNAVLPVAGDSALVLPSWTQAAPAIAAAGASQLLCGGTGSAVVDGDGDGEGTSLRQKSLADIVTTSSAQRARSSSTLASSIPLGRWATARDVANAAAWLCSDEADFITGVCLKVDGGRSLV